ncbi:hypothetical protein HYY72_00960 [Candidatus Woesearchaeota archaeon]|nr:hypothetical protein [Candidatus Woesearchaeota archaeon]
MNTRITASLLAISLVFLIGCTEQPTDMIRCSDGTLASDASLCPGTGSSSSSSSSSSGGSNITPPPMPDEDLPALPSIN